MKNEKFKYYLLALIISFLFIPHPAFAMHIMEGFLPLKWCLFWGIVSFPFIIFGLHAINKTIKENSKLKMLLAVSGAFIFVLSALKIPSITGSCSHPTGIGLGAVLFGPAPMAVLGAIVLLFQSLLLAHGGLTTLGANIFSMAIVGGFSTYVIYSVLNKFNTPKWLAIFLASSIGDLLTYVTTSIQLALSFPAQGGDFLSALIKFLGIFSITQIPLAISEGILTVIIFDILTNYNSEELKQLNILKKEV